MAMLEEDDELVSADVFITPPEQGEVTDEDSGPEDDGGTVNNLSGAQLRCEAQSVVQHSNETHHVGDEDGPDSNGSTTDYGNEDSEKSASAPPPKKAKVKAVERKWCWGDLATELPVWNVDKPAYLKNDINPTFIFDLLFDDEVIDFIVSMTNLYALQKGKTTFSVSATEIRAMLAILLISGYASLPSRRMFWENNDDVHNDAITSIMSVNRFEEIL